MQEFTWQSIWHINNTFQYWVKPPACKLVPDTFLLWHPCQIFENIYSNTSWEVIWYQIRYFDINFWWDIFIIINFPDTKCFFLWRGAYKVTCKCVSASHVELKTEVNSWVSTICHVFKTHFGAYFIKYYSCHYFLSYSINDNWL